MTDTVKVDLFDSPVKMKLYKIMYPLLSEDERGDAFLRISNMSDDQVLKVIKTFPEGKPTVAKNMGGIVSLDQLIRPIGMM